MNSTTQAGSLRQFSVSKKNDLSLVYDEIFICSNFKIKKNGVTLSFSIMSKKQLTNWNILLIILIKGKSVGTVHILFFEIIIGTCDLKPYAKAKIQNVCSLYWNDTQSA